MKLKVRFYIKFCVCIFTILLLRVFPCTFYYCKPNNHIVGQCSETSTKSTPTIVPSLNGEESPKSRGMTTNVQHGSILDYSKFGQSANVCSSEFGKLARYLSREYKFLNSTTQD